MDTSSRTPVVLPRAVRRQVPPPGLLLLTGLVLTPMSWFFLLVGLMGLVVPLLMGACGLVGAVYALHRGFGTRIHAFWRGVAAVTVVLGFGPLLVALWFTA